ncbi:MAG TPA: tetratricopeptide repeat protein [Edaphobacter sp.]
MFNPFPGLRPFEADEDHLFFGREKEIDELLRRLRVCRFMSIIGTSGSGKSSLVRSGLIPSLYGGFMVGTNPSWRIAIMRPGEDPVRHLAVALNSPEVLGATGELEATNSVLLEATLRRGTRGLVEAVRQARVLGQDNLLIVVDQFEELFRFRRNYQLENSRNEAVAFVKLLLEAAQQEELPIYIVITMRSDFIGDCMDFAGLPEAVNSGLYLVPRMTRDELRSAITGPVAVGGGNIAQRLVLRLLNDFGDEYDQLPILQHALMRTWDYWARRAPATDAIDIEDYEAIGTFRQALSIHAEEAYEETGSDNGKKLSERIFKALTDTFSDRRGIRRPTSVGDLTAISESTEVDVVRIIEIFRRPGRSFLMPPADVPLDKGSIVDLSHESLMRCWTRLVGWAEEERVSAEIYSRLSDAAMWFEEGRSGLWRNPELEVGQKWRFENRPTAAWGQRYNSSFNQVMGFLDRSEEEWKRLNEEKRRERQKKLRQTQWAAGILGSLFLLALFLAYFAWKQTHRAENNLQLAKKAVDESLSSAGRENGREAGDLPQVEEFRKELLDKAEAFYTLFAQQNSTNPNLRSEEARAHSRLGDINRLMGRNREAVREYNESIAQFAALAKQYPAQNEFRQALAYSHNWMGETIRDALDKRSDLNLTSSDAEKEYSEAIHLQEELHKQEPTNALYQQEFARTYYNRGIIRYGMHAGDGMRSDFRKAIELLEPLISKAQSAVDVSENPDPAQDLARVYNNYAIVVSSTGQTTEAQDFYEKAIALTEKLVQKRPENREYKVELAQYCSNEARMLADAGESRLTEARSQRALALIEELTEPTPSLSIKMVQALQLRGQLLRPHDPAEAKTLTDQAFDLLRNIDERSANNTSPFSALYMNIGVNYLELAQDDLERGDRTDAKTALTYLTAILSHLSPEDKQILIEPYKNIQGKLSAGPNRH